jgi:DNA-binding MarR family transcriptional regulator
MDATASPPGGARPTGWTRYRLPGVGLPDWDVSSVGAGPPYRLTVGELQRLSLVTTGAVSQRVERAARRGLVRRSPAAGDARKVVVELTEDGRTAAAAAELLRVVLDAEQSVLEPLDADDRPALEELLRAWSVGLGAARAVGPVADPPA